MSKRYLTRECSCNRPVVMGQKRPDECVHGNHFQTEAELNRKPRKPLPKVSKKRQASGKGAGLKRTQRRESAAERKAREHFNETVKAWPCWFRAERACEKCGGSGFIDSANPDLPIRPCPACEGDGRHHCTYPKDAHHLVPKDYLRRMFGAVLPEPEFVAILFNPLIGAPICRRAHEAIEAGFDRIYFGDLSDEALEYVGSLPDFVLIRLENECPKRPTLERETVG